MTKIAGSPFSVPKRPVPERVGPDKWPDIELVASGGSTGTAPSWDTSAVKNGDIMVAFGVIRNGTISGPDGGGWTAVTSVDRSSNEWNKVYAKVAADQGATLTFSMSTHAAAGFGVWRCSNYTLTSIVSSYNTALSHPITRSVVAPALAVSVQMSAAFNAVAAAPGGVMGGKLFSDADASDENVRGYWVPIWEDMTVGSAVVQTNEVQNYGTRTLIIVTEA